jgi:hypothetical protein
MKQLLTSAVFIMAAITAHAQTDTTKTETEKPDTIKVGGMVIINKKGSDPGTVNESSGSSSDDFGVYFKKSNKGKSGRRLATSWLNFDFGFNNYIDRTDYTTAEAKDYARAVRPGEEPYTKEDLRVDPGKSINFNLWIVKQRWGISRDNKFNVKWGLMLETNNYRYVLRNSYVNAPSPYVFRDSFEIRKNKLAMDYLTVPLLIGFNTKPYAEDGFAVSVGVSMGYLYSSRNKQVSTEYGKRQNRSNFGFEPWKFQYLAEIGIGIVKLYGSYSPQTFYVRGLDISPYNVGLRFGEWW